MKDPYEIIQGLVITEESVRLMQGEPKKYTFRVAKDANKIEIRKAVEEIAKPDKVTVVKVNTMNVRGKRRRIGRGRESKRPDWKKAIVTLAPGQVIQKFEAV